MWHLCFLTALSASAAPSPARLYDITIQTSMPHLEENLRYANTRTQRCLTRDDLDSAFPILDHPSLAGCKLQKRNHDEDSLFHVLVCENSATTGTAKWQPGERVIRGTLDVKLGGKNMTVSQRVTATLIGECPTWD